MARHSGVFAETVERIVEYQLAEQRQIDSQRVVTDIGLDELSLKKRHRLYMTLLTDLSDPALPGVSAAARDKDKDAALKCLAPLGRSNASRSGPHWVDMGPAYPPACAMQLHPAAP